MKATTSGLYATPTIRIAEVRSEAGFAVSYDPNENTEHLGEYGEETL